MRLFRIFLTSLLLAALFGVAAWPPNSQSDRLEASGQNLRTSLETSEDALDDAPDDAALEIPSGESCEEAVADLESSEGVCLGSHVLEESLDGEAPEPSTDDTSDLRLVAASDCTPYSTTRKISDYTVERADSFIYIKDGEQEACGALSVRTSLGDRTPNYRIMFQWKAGAAITFSNFVYRVRKSDAGPDTVMDPSNDVPNATVRFGSTTVWVPSSTGSRSSGTYLTGDAGVKYHEDFGLGTIKTSGKTFGASTMHTGRWNRCSSSTGCKYYQVPWKTSP